MHHIQFIYIRYIHAITSGNAKSSGPTIPSWAHWPPRSGVRTYAIHGFSKQVQVLPNIMLLCKPVQDCLLAPHCPGKTLYQTRNSIVLA